MVKRIFGKDRDYIENEDWKINAWDKDGKLIIEDGEPVKE